MPPMLALGEESAAWCPSCTRKMLTWTVTVVKEVTSTIQTAQAFDVHDMFHQ